MDKLRIQSLNTLVQQRNITQKNKNESIQIQKSFDEVLHQINNKNEVKFTKHANQRMNIRNINLSDEEIIKLETALDKAENKGVKEALILMGDTAFIASVKNRTIITTANAEQLKDNVFTNIDGAVII